MQFHKWKARILARQKSLCKCSNKVSKSITRKTLDAGEDTLLSGFILIRSFSPTSLCTEYARPVLVPRPATVRSSARGVRSSPRRPRPRSSRRGCYTRSAPDRSPRQNGRTRSERSDLPTGGGGVTGRHRGGGGVIERHRGRSQVGTGGGGGGAELLEGVGGGPVYCDRDG